MGAKRTRMMLVERWADEWDRIATRLGLKLPADTAELAKALWLAYPERTVFEGADAFVPMADMLNISKRFDDCGRHVYILADGLPERLESADMASDLPAVIADAPFGTFYIKLSEDGDYEGVVVSIYDGWDDAGGMVSDAVEFASGDCGRVLAMGDFSGSSKRGILVDAPCGRKTVSFHAVSKKDFGYNDGIEPPAYPIGFICNVLACVCTRPSSIVYTPPAILKSGKSNNKKRRSTAVWHLVS